MGNGNGKVNSNYFNKVRTSTNDDKEESTLFPHYVV
jgi:hypothetical protein